MSDTTPPRPSFAAALFGVAAIFLLATGIVAVTVVAANDDDTVDAAAAPATEAAASVSLSEFSIDPDAITVGVNGDIQVTNAGTVEHNLAIEGEDVRTPNLAAGDSATLSVGDLAAGDYQIICEIPGHADSGMRAALTISEEGATAVGDEHAGHGGGETSTTMDYQAMT